MSGEITQEILDRYEIEQVLRRYCRGVDRGDAELIRSVYHPDAMDDHGGLKGLGVDFADRVVVILNERAQATMHNMHQVNIETNGDAASVETYFTAYHRVLEDGATVLETFGGRYVDRFEKRDGQWKIADRVVVYDWSEIKPVPREYPNEDFQHGKRSKEDLSYRSV